MDTPCGPEHLHAPWRMEYIARADQPKDACVFCVAAREADRDQEHLIVYRGTHHFIILNRFPYNSGHVMIVPYCHTAELSDLPAEAQAEMMELVTLALTALRRVMCPNGFNLGMNLGRAAGAGIATHLHLHVVPRWGGDTNFMTVTGNVRVLPESLESTWAHVRDAICAIVAENGTQGR